MGEWVGGWVGGVGGALQHVLDAGVGVVEAVVGEVDASGDAVQLLRLPHDLTTHRRGDAMHFPQKLLMPSINKGRGEEGERG